MNTSNFTSANLSNINQSDIQESKMGDQVFNNKRIPMEFEEIHGTQLNYM